MSYTRDKKITLIVYFLFYYALFASFYLDDRLLSQYQPIFFTHNRDLTELILIATGLPRWMMAHPWTFTAADTLAFGLPAALLAYALQKGRFSPVLGIAFGLFLGGYLLLADLFWQVHHEPFVLYLLLALAWMTNREERFYQVLKGCRYYFLYIFTSAALWKIARGAVFNGQEMSRILLFHHSDLLSGPCDSFACRTYRYLVDHPGLSYGLYLGGAALEGCFVVGFFTRRWDRVLIGLTVVFVVADLLLMRIPYWTVLLGTITLWLGSGPVLSGSSLPFRRHLPFRRPLPPREKKIIIYETTHHENLPALLDLSEAHFSEVAVFLKELSYHNLSGYGSPERRWPRTDFFVQPEDCSNRRFISQLFAFLKRHRYSHLHLSTLDNNLLVFVFRLTGAGTVHLSLTVHEVNEYFTFSFRSLRDWSESIAKFFLHRQIRHYTLFLPAMVDRFRQKLPEATAVFIPSRFYPGQHPSGPAQSPFIIVIPGSVEPNRRNYNEVIQTLTLFLSRNNPPVELVILGDSRTEAGAAIIASLQALECGRLRLRHFKGYIPETVYEQELAGAHLIWSPLNLHKIGSRNNPETYGLTTASGLTADLLLNDIPALIPEGFVIPEPFRAAVLPYGSPETALEIIERLIGDPAGYQAIRGNIRQAFAWFSKENFMDAFMELTNSDPPRNQP
ncbi:MAG TPA: glycosyltransferase [Puia sp.]|nr:glycosyltransferase [Puia sp.]